MGGTNIVRLVTGQRNGLYGWVIVEKYSSPVQVVRMKENTGKYQPPAGAFYQKWYGNPDSGVFTLYDYLMFLVQVNLTVYRIA